MITEDEAAGAIMAMRICRYFPAEDLQRSQLAAILLAMVGTKDQLDWLVREQSKRDWKGPYELRVLFCSRFRALDVLDEREAEQRYFEDQSRETDRMLAEQRREHKLLDTPDPIESPPAIEQGTRTERDLRSLSRYKRVQQYLERC